MKSRVIICGKGGSGKDYLKKVYGTSGFKLDVSYTSRPPREGEIDGLDYYFLSKEEFQAKIDAGLMYEYVTFNGWMYGTAMYSWKNNDVFIMTPSGIEQIDAMERKKCFIIYLDIDYQIRLERLSLRTGDFDNAFRRIEADEKDFANFVNYDIRITNPDF